MCIRDRVYSIVGWGQSHGEIIDNNDIVTTGKFNDGTLKQIQHTLWKGYNSKPSNLDNRALVSDTKHVNTTIAQALSLIHISSTLLFQYFNLTTFLLLESGCQGIGFNNTSQTYLSFFLIKMKLFCNLLIHKCISHEQF